MDVTPEVLLKYIGHDEMKNTCKTETSIKRVWGNCSLLIRHDATQLKHSLPPIIIVDVTDHWMSPQPKAKDSLHVLQGDGHLATG
jgi:hypothetical protein